MDAFQESEAKRALIARNLVPCWVEFRSAVESLIPSYNETRGGKVHPASVAPVGELAIVVSSDRGPADDEYHTVTIVITISLKEGEYVIAATEETWHTRQGLKLSKQDEYSYEFKLDGDLEEGKVWLVSTEFGKHITPFEAAEALLMKILDTP
jgi:hypothetical protein